MGDRLFKTTLDAHVVAISAKSGAILWDAVMENFRNGYSGTPAPLAFKDKVVVGMAGAEYGVRGFVDAYDVQTGKRAWRFYTTAGPEDPGHRAGPGREGLGARRRFDVDHRFVRSGTESDFLGHRQRGT
jgi:alcohol dehydrogenase (cytochrome c)